MKGFLYYNTSGIDVVHTGYCFFLSTDLKSGAPVETGAVVQWLNPNAHEKVLKIF
jgi:hypothetical protein